MKDTPYYLPVYTFKENSTVFYLSSKGCKQNAILTLLDHQIMTTRSPSMYFSIPPHPAFETIWRKYFKYIFLFSFLWSSFMDKSITCKYSDYDCVLWTIFHIWKYFWLTSLISHFSTKITKLTFFSLFSSVLEHQFHLFLFFIIPQITTCRNMTFVDGSCTKLNKNLFGEWR